MDTAKETQWECGIDEGRMQWRIQRPKDQLGCQSKPPGMETREWWLKCQFSAVDTGVWAREVELF